MPDGMTNNRILDLEQDQDGFLWIITEKGLSRYDGYEIKTYPYQFNFLLDRDLFSQKQFDDRFKKWDLDHRRIPSPQFLR